MIHENLNLGGEQSGHIIMRDYTSSGDGIIVALQVLAIIMQKEKQASEILNLFMPHPQNLVNFEVKTKDILESDETKNFIKKCEEEVAGEGRIVVRMSGTEPLLRVMIECKSQNKIDELTKNVTKYFS